jgi:hypothetical protein
MRILIAVAVAVGVLSATPANATSHTTHHHYGVTHHRLTGTKTTRYLHATHRKHK